MKKKKEEVQELSAEVEKELSSEIARETEVKEETFSMDQETPDTTEDEIKKSINKIMNTKNMGMTVNGVSEEDINSWKAEYGDIYHSIIGEFDFFWHKIRRSDYVKIMSDENLNKIDNIDIKIYYRQDIIIKSSVISPNEEELDKILEENAGISTTLADEIMIRSGFGRAQSEKV